MASTCWRRCKRAALTPAHVLQVSSTAPGKSFQWRFDHHLSLAKLRDRTRKPLPPQELITPLIEPLWRKLQKTCIDYHEETENYQKNFIIYNVYHFESR
jgi:hypothetical protein